MEGIVVGFDGSEGAQAALEWAVTAAERWQSPLTAVVVVPRAVTLGPDVAPMVGSVEQERLGAMGEMARVAVEKASAGRDVRTQVRAVAGGPAEELLNASADADLLVVGSRGHGGFARLLLGSVSSQCAHHATCPVVVVPPRKGQ
jgi:nucleotide-binding universal stress UspA family protein